MDGFHMIFATNITQNFLKNGLTQDLIKNFQSIIWDHYFKTNRIFPWRKTDNQYYIYISEFMLQQTQAERVVEKYEKFIEKFPNFKELANASIDEVLSVWQGLGYNRRAIWVRDGAKIIIQNYKGILPKDPIELEKIKGVGHATAREMTAFAYNTIHAFIETNIRRVFIYFFYPNKKEIKDSEILKLVEKTVDNSNPREWYYALMDYGVFLKKKYPNTNPNLRSKKYKKQSKFKGSNRELRGKLLQIIMKEKEIKLEEIMKKLNSNDKRIILNIKQLEKEGFLNVEKKTITINSN